MSRVWYHLPKYVQFGLDKLSRAQKHTYPYCICLEISFVRSYFCVSSRKVGLNYSMYFDGRMTFMIYGMHQDNFHFYTMSHGSATFRYLLIEFNGNRCYSMLGPTWYLMYSTPNIFALGMVASFFWLPDLRQFLNYFSYIFFTSVPGNCASSVAPQISLCRRMLVLTREYRGIWIDNYITCHRIGIVLSFFSSRPKLGPSHPLTCGRGGGGAHSLAGERVGGLPIRTGGQTLWYSGDIC